MTQSTFISYITIKNNKQIIKKSFQNFYLNKKQNYKNNNYNLKNTKNETLKIRFFNKTKRNKQDLNIL